MPRSSSLTAEANFEPDPAIKMVNGDFEQTKGNTFTGFGFHDQPGEVSFADTQVFHGGKTSLRMENFTANPHGHGRIMQTVKVKPHRSYRVCLWIKTDGLQPTNAFNISVLVGDRNWPRVVQPGLHRRLAANAS